MMGYPIPGEKSDDMMTRFDTIYERDGHTDTA